jgi:hypothetical protein
MIKEKQKLKENNWLEYLLCSVFIILLCSLLPWIYVRMFLFKNEKKLDLTVKQNMFQVFQWTQF